MRSLIKTYSVSFLAVSTLAALFTALCAQVRIPLGFTPIPLTLQVFGVICIGLWCDRRLALLSQLEYVALGIAGLPVFAGGNSGLVYLLGPTGGYILGFGMAAYTISYLRSRSKTVPPMASGLVGVGVIYLFGAIWLAAWLAFGQGLPWQQVWLQTWYQGVFPFLGGDMIKALAAAGISQAYMKKVRP